MSTTTGSVTFHEIPPGDITVEVIYQNMAAKTGFRMPEDDHTTTVQLTEGIIFNVYEAYSQQPRIPIAGVAIEIREVRTNQTVTLQTDQNGRASIPLVAGSYRVRFSRTGYVEYTMNLVVDQDYQSGTFNIDLHRTLAVRVMNGRNNQPVQNAVVSATVGTSTISFTTDAQGNAYLNLPSGTHTVNVTPPAGTGLEPTSFSVEIPLNPTSQVTRQVTLTPAGIRVRVLNPRNNRAPVDGVTVYLLRPNQPSPPQSQALATVTTDAQGNAVFVYLDHSNVITVGSSYDIEVTKEGFRRTRRSNIQVTNINQSVNVEIEMPWTLLTVNVRDPRGQPVSGATVRVIRGGSVIREGTTR